MPRATAGRLLQCLQTRRVVVQPSNDRFRTNFIIQIFGEIDAMMLVWNGDSSPSDHVAAVLPIFRCP